MATRQYIVTIETPEGEDEFDYEVTIEVLRGKLVSNFKNNLIACRDSIGPAIFDDIELEDNRPTDSGPRTPAVVFKIGDTVRINNPEWPTWNRSKFTVLGTYTDRKEGLVYIVSSVTGTQGRIKAQYLEKT